MLVGTLGVSQYTKSVVDATCRTPNFCTLCILVLCYLLRVVVESVRIKLFQKKIYCKNKIKKKNKKQHINILNFFFSSLFAHLQCYCVLVCSSLWHTQKETERGERGPNQQPTQRKSRTFVVSIEKLRERMQQHSSILFSLYLNYSTTSSVFFRLLFLRLLFVKITAQNSSNAQRELS